TFPELCNNPHDPHPSPTRRSSDLFKDALAILDGLETDADAWEDNRKSIFALKAMVFHALGRADQARAALRESLKLKDGDLSNVRSEEHTSELQSQSKLVCRLMLEK